MQLSDFYFELPESLIATGPVHPRDSSRLLVMDRKTGTISHRVFRDLSQIFGPKDLLLLNNTRVLPARLYGQTPTGSRIEILLLKPEDSRKNLWSCLVKRSKKVHERLEVQFSEVKATIIRLPSDQMQVEFPEELSFEPWLEEVGFPPLPPYIKRQATESDRKSYQTVFAQKNGSIAAPTAGLHFTSELLNELKQKGVRTAELTLHVGYGTFAPIRVSQLKEHHMHFERYEVPPWTLTALKDAKAQGDRVVAVGTTSLRALESLPFFGPKGETNIFIQPGFTFSGADALLTNFHLPESSLYVLVCAFAGMDFARKAYEEAVRLRYRFFSYGDAMLIL